MRSNYRDEVNKILASLENDKDNQEPKTEIPDTQSQEPIREIHVIFVREEEDDEQHIVDSTVTDLDTAPLSTQPAPEPVTNALLGVLLLGILIPIFCIAAQLSFIVNPFTVNVTLAARSQQVSLSGTLQQGRVLNPITVSQSATVPTTGHAHQDAKAATGFITFYNGQFQSVPIAAGTILQGSSGIQIVTDQDTTIPAGNPPSYGQVTVSAHAINSGVKGNIPAYDINQIYTNAVLVKNTTAFSGGQDEREFQTVTKTDISNASAPVKATVTQGSTAALQGQLKTNEAITTPSCTTTTTPDHQPGEETTTVKVSVSETCSAVAYNQDTLQAKVTQLLTAQAAKTLETGYSLLGDPQITVTQATTNHTSLSPVTFLSFNAQSTWIYALSTQEQHHIKNMIAGKNTLNAKQLLHSLPGIESVSMQSSGFGDDSRIPKDISYIHMLIIYTPA